ncbi:MAG: hypothetical protein HQ582_15855 [Planctomycetes bacterium]|nr:hypothetical protein [Planctomycetota bacterium]
MSTEDPKRYSLLDSLRQEWIKLPLTIMQDVGAATQTMGGLLAITLKETFVPLSDIAERARLPAGTMRKHLVALDAGGWINRKGRKRTERGRLRRTTTIAITTQTRKAIEPYTCLPWWFTHPGKFGRPTWGAKVVLSLVMSRLMGLAKAAEEKDGADDDLALLIEDVTGDPEDRFRFPLRQLVRDTGQDHRALSAGKAQLARFGIVEWIGVREQKKGVRTIADSLAPRWDFRVVVTPAGNGMASISFER